MGDYAAAKAAAETMCSFLAKTHPQVKFHTPRYPRLATDQTATVVAIATADTKNVLLDSLRGINQNSTTVSKPVKVIEPAPVASGPAFAITATFTAEPIEPALRFWMSMIGQTGQVEFSPYNQVFQALLDPTELLSRNNFSNAVLIRLEDWIEGINRLWMPRRGERNCRR